MLIVSLLIAIYFLVMFLWATKDGQYDDDYSPSVRILFEEKEIISNQNNKHNGSTTSKV
jgi:cbb3-type cytochrome oxidase maturation protein